MSAKGEVERRSWAPAWADWLDWMETGMPRPGLRPFGFERSMRCEEFVEEGKYTIRAELPGIDPDKDVSITLDDGVLTITAERSETVKEKKRSEFYYGKMTRSVTLPKGADGEAVTAEYADGILTVSVPVPATPSPSHVTVPITRS